MTANLPDVHQLKEREQILWLLVALKDKQEDFSSAHISDLLANRFAVAIPRQRVRALLKQEQEARAVSVTTRAGIDHFKIMRRGEDQIIQISPRPLFIEPSKALSSIRAVEDVLRLLQGSVRICDAYVDSRTLDYLTQMGDAKGVQLLTENVQDSSRFKRDLAAYQNEYSLPIEVRVAAPGHLHDRYVLHDGGMLIMGASLKDLGKKQSMIVGLSHSFAQDVDRGFIRLWSNATKFP